MSDKVLPYYINVEDQEWQVPGWVQSGFAEQLIKEWFEAHIANIQRNEDEVEHWSELDKQAAKNWFEFKDRQLDELNIKLVDIDLQSRNEQLNKAIEQFKQNAPELSNSQVQQLTQCWYDLQDRVRDIFWDDSWLNENGDMKDESMQEEAMHTTGALGAAMLDTYKL